MNFGFLITAHCNASCAHCTVNSGPRQTTALRPDQIVGLMDQAAVIWRRERAPGEKLEFGISGGEPFLDFERLCRIVAHGAGLGAVVSCVTNGSWATSDEKANARLGAVRAVGLSWLAVSTSRFHQRYVKPDRVRRVLDLARGHGIQTILKCAVTTEDQEPDGLVQWARSQDADHLEEFPVLPYLREGESLPEDRYVRAAGLPEGACPAPRITVRENGSAYTCCMPGGFTDLLKLGNAIEDGLDPVYDRFYLGEIQQVLRHRGPTHLARAIRARGEGHRLRDQYAGICDLCAHIAADPVMAGIAADVATDFAAAELRRALRQVQRQTPHPPVRSNQEFTCHK